MRETKVIEKEILPEYFEEVIKGRKTFEIRKDEDDIQPGDTLILNEFVGDKYTGRSWSMLVGFVYRGTEYGLQEGWCVISLIDPITCDPFISFEC